MDFDKFLERDIIEFLDEQAMKIAEKAAGLREEEFDLYEITQDYSKEINEALRKGDVRKAQKVFEEVKDKYLNAPEGSLSKKRFYIIMEEIYERIKDFEAKEEGKKSLFETIREYEEKGLFTKPELFQKKEALSISLALSTITKKEKELEKLTTKKQVGGEDLKQAIKKYKEIKELIRRMPNSHPKEKSKAYESALSWYYTIKKLEKDFIIRREVKKVREVKIEVPVEKKLAEVRKLKKEIVDSHTRITGYLKKKELSNCIKEYRHLKKLCEGFPHEMEEEKTALLADALSLYESIKKLKQELVQKKGREMVEKEEERLEKQEKEARKKEILERLGKIKEFLAKKDALSSIKEYKELKEVFTHFPEHPLEEKKELYEEILASHKDIKLLEEDLKRKSPSYKEKIMEIDKILGGTHALLDKGNLEQASHSLLEAKHRIQMLPKEAFDEKYRLLKDVEKLEHKFLFVKNIQRINAPNVMTT